MVEVHDRLIGDVRMSIVTDNGDITFVVIGNHHIMPEDFEAMYGMYLTFFEEGFDVEA